MVIADTGFWLALANLQDRDHRGAVSALTALGSEPLIVTWPVMTETCHMLLRRLGNLAQERFIKSHACGAYRVADPSIYPPKQIAPLMEKYRQLPMDLADASLVLLAEHLGHGRIFSSDRRDFQTYRWKRNKPFENLMPESEP